MKEEFINLLIELTNRRLIVWHKVFYFGKPDEFFLETIVEQNKIQAHRLNDYKILVFRKEHPVASFYHHNFVSKIYEYCYPENIFETALREVINDLEEFV